jgi:hypothetical protein
MRPATVQPDGPPPPLRAPVNCHDICAFAIDAVTSLCVGGRVRLGPLRVSEECLAWKAQRYDADFEAYRGH